MPAPTWQADQTQPALAERRSCRRCGADIVHGEPQFPIEGIGRMHLACAQVRPPSPSCRKRGELVWLRYGQQEAGHPEVGC